jgi:glutathione S-transferase
MQLYFSPLACSLASRVALYEAGLDATFVEVDPLTKQLPDGLDYRATYGLGLVPALRTDDGVLITENAAVLQHIDALWHGPAAPAAARTLQQWLSFIGTELHKGTFSVLFDPRAPAEAKTYALAKAKPRLEYAAKHLADREFVLDAFGVADAYLYTVLNWTQATPIALAAYPALKAYHARIAARPQVARAFKEELPLYQAERARAAAAAS